MILGFINGSIENKVGMLILCKLLDIGSGHCTMGRICIPLRVYRDRVVPDLRDFGYVIFVERLEFFSLEQKRLGGI